MFPPDGSHTPDTFAGASPLRRLSTQGTVMTERQSVGLSFSPRTGPAAPHNPKSPKSPRPTDSIASMRSLGRKRSTQATLPFPNERETMVLDGGVSSTGLLWAERKMNSPLLMFPRHSACLFFSCALDSNGREKIHEIQDPVPVVDDSLCFLFKQRFRIQWS